MLILHFISNVYYISNAASAVMYGMGTVSNVTQTVWLTGWCLAGLPVILAAFWGVIQRVESLIRLYFWYQIVSVAIDMYFVVMNFVVRSPCQVTAAVVQGSGSAFSCGVARGVNVTSVSLIVGLQLYMIFIVWSYCEDLAEGGPYAIGDLVLDWTGKPMSKAAIDKMAEQRKKHEDPYTSMDGLYNGPGNAATSWNSFTGGSGYIGSAYGTIYDQAATEGLGCQRIFNGTFHEMRYPPPSMRS
jgi:hypothetical protein